MRSLLVRPALCFSVALVAMPLSRLVAADPVVDTPAPVVAPAPEATTAAPVTTPADGSAPAVVPAVTPAAEPAPTPVAPAAVAEPAPVPDQSTLEAKMAVVLRSYTVLQEENDQLKAAAEKSATERSALEAQLGVAKESMPLAAQAAALREQLRQTQDQLAAMSLENNQLKTRLATLPPGPGSSNLTPTSVPTTLTPAVVPAAAGPVGPRTHVVAAGETLSQISVHYYGSASRWQEILAANRDVLKSEKSLRTGMKLKIP